jgi:hypothetical protein
MFNFKKNIIIYHTMGKVNLKKSVTKMLSKVTNEKFLKKNMYKILLVVFIVAYVKYMSKVTPKPIIRMLDSLFVKAAVVCAIVYIASKDMVYGVLLTVLFTYTLYVLNVKKTEFFTEHLVPDDAAATDAAATDAAATATDAAATDAAATDAAATANDGTDMDARLSGLEKQVETIEVTVGQLSDLKTSLISAMV